MERTRRILWVMIVALWASFFWLPNMDWAAAKDPDYPTKPIEFYINMAAGGSTDLSCRAFIEAAGKHLEQPMIPINKVGGSGAICAMAVKNAKPDGYTLGNITTSSTFVVPFSDDAPYKDLSGFTFLAKYGNNIFPVIVRGDAPWRNWKEFIDWAKKNPRGTKVGITGAKTADYKGLVLWQVEKREQAEFTYLAYKGGSEVLSAILGGHINLYASTIDPSTLSYIKEGKLRILTYIGTAKVQGHEDIPSTKEMYGFEGPSLLAVCGPKGLPPYVLKKLDDAFAKAVKDPNFIKLMERMNMPIEYINRVELTKYVEDVFNKTAKIYAGVKEEEMKKK